MKRKIITTADGSKTIQIEDWNEQYHSKHGAINEANHVFIKHGLLHFFNTSVSESPHYENECHAELVEASHSDCHLESFDCAQDKLSREVAILEIGFGTGLNAFLTALQAEALNLNINYVGVEAYPVSIEEINQLNYVEEINPEANELFAKIHEADWEKPNAISSNFTLTKRQQFFQEIEENDAYDIIYFDAFGSRVQPELWSKTIFQKMYKALKPKGVLTTYAAIGQVKRDMQDLGFEVERLQGPPGKRHMLRASK